MAFARKVAALAVLALALAVESERRAEVQREAEQVSLRGHWRRFAGLRLSGRAALGRRSFHERSGGGIQYLTDWSDLTFTRASEASYVDPRDGWAFETPPVALDPMNAATALESWRADTGFTIGTNAEWVGRIAGENLDEPASTGPTIGSAGGQVSLAFSGTQQLGATFTTIAPGPDASVLIVAKVNTTTGNQTFYDGVASGNRHCLINLNGGALRAIAASSFDLGVSADPTRLQAILVDYATAARAFADDLATPISGDTGSHTLTGLFVGVNHILGNRLNGDVSELTIFSSSPTDAERAGIATYLHERYAGIEIQWEGGRWLPDDAPRILSDGSILIEGARTNFLTHGSELDVTSGNWTAGTATITADYATAPDGSDTADRVVAASGELSHYYDIGGVPGSIGTYSAFAKRGPTSDGTINSGLNAGSPSYAGSNYTASLPASGWERIYLTDQRRYVIPADGRDSSAGGGLTAGARDVTTALHQYEAGTFPSSPIRTSGATATRAADSATLAVDAALETAIKAPGGFVFDFWPAFGRDTVTPAATELFDVGAGDFQLYRAGTTGADWVLADAAGAVCTLGAASFDWSAHDRLQVTVVAPETGDWTLTIENLTAGGSATDTATPTSVAALSGSTLTVGNYGSGTGFSAWGVISRWWSA